jgi:hypothetical protein
MVMKESEKTKTKIDGGFAWNCENLPLCMVGLLVPSLFGPNDSIIEFLRAPFLSFLRVPGVERVSVS